MTWHMDYDNWLMRWHNYGGLKKAVELAGLRGSESVLDFGCFTRDLRRFLPFRDLTKQYVGYDILPEYSMIDDYRKLKNIDVVFALNVLEHLFSGKEVAQALKNFRKIGAKKVVVSLPSENWLEEFLKVILNRELSDAFEHSITTKQVTRELKREYGLPNTAIRFHLLRYIVVFNLEKTKGIE